MPLYRVRRERCIPYDIFVEAPDQQTAEDAAYRQDVETGWSEDSEYWQELDTEEMDEGEYDPDICVNEDGQVRVGNKVVDTLYKPGAE
jgi:hypothetical protein